MTTADTLIELRAGISEARYDTLNRQLSLKGWLSDAGPVQSVQVRAGDTVLISQVELNTSRIDIKKKFGVTSRAPNGFEHTYTVDLDGDAKDLALVITPQGDGAQPLNVPIALKVMQGPAAFKLTQCVYDTESKFLKLAGSAYPDVPQRGLRIMLHGGRSEPMQEQFLPAPNFTEKTGGHINKFGGFATTVKHVGEGALSSIKVIADLIDGTETSWEVDPSTLLYDQPAAEITRVRLNQLTDRMIVEGWYRAYEPVTSLELRVFGDECYAIPEITEDEELTRKLGFRGPRVFRFQYHTELSVALNDADRLPSADGQSATVELDLMSRRESLATFAAAPEVVERITSRASYIVFDKRKSVLMVWGQCAPGKPPKRVAFHVGGRQVGDSLVPVLPDADPTAKISTWFVAEEVNFELKAGQKIQLYVEAEDGALEQIGGLPEPVIVSARNVVETPSKDSVTKALHEHNATRTNLEEPTVCFAFQGSMTSVGGAVTRITNMMSAFKRAGYSVILLDRTAPWEFYEGLENYKALRRICDLHLTIPQFYKSDLLGLSTAAWEKRSDLSASEKTLLGYLRRSKKEGRLLKGADPLYNRVDSHFNYACAAVLHDLRPDVVITQFAWSCEMHTALPEGTFGFIDTHDVQSARYLNFKAAAETYGAAAVPELARFQVDRNVEQKFLSMADAAIAISPDEHEDLNDMIGSRRTVLATLSRQDGEPIGSPKDSRSVLFVGNNYAANNYGIRTFIEQMWVKVLAAVPDAQLNVIGTCCDSIDDLKETQNVTLHGRVDDLSDLYGEAAVVINPMYFGTGMAVKMVEALGAGKAVVSTPVGARGLEEAGRHGAVKIAETSAAFEADTIALLKDSKARAKLEKAASTYSQTYLAGDVVYSNLFNFIESRLFY